MFAADSTPVRVGLQEQSCGLAMTEDDLQAHRSMKA